MAVWMSWVLWTSGVTLRWAASVYQWQWRALLPLSAIFEIAAFVIFFYTVPSHRPQESGKQRLEEWVWVVIAGSAGLMLTLLTNFGLTLYLVLSSKTPAVPASLDQRLLLLQTWGFLVPFVWGFSAKWLPIFLGLWSIHKQALFLAVAANSAGVLAALAGRAVAAAFLLLTGVGAAVYALRLFERPQRPAKIKGVHASFPVFVRLAYVWAIIAASLGIWAVWVENSQGILGASRHALTVGFLATMVFCIGPRVVPAFSGMRLLFSTRLMSVALLLLTVGCLVRVSAEILAYQGFVRSAWSWLPLSAVTEMAAVTVFAMNLLATFGERPSSTRLTYRETT